MSAAKPYVTDPAAARAMAEDEYAHRPSRDRGIMLLSRGADGGMHYRGTVNTTRAADIWRARKVDDLTRRILSGRVDDLLVFPKGTSGFYLG